LAFYASTPNYRGVLDLHGWTGIGEKLSDKVRRGEFADLGDAVPDEMLDAFAVSAPPDRAPAALRERYQGLVDRVSVYFPIPPAHSEARWRTFAEAFRRAG
jgi:hypothetical protein